jgi:hypothetical protein
MKNAIIKKKSKHALYFKNFKYVNNIFDTKLKLILDIVTWGCNLILYSYPTTIDIIFSNLN